MRRQLYILMLLITGMLVSSVNFISPNRALLGSSTVSAALQGSPFVNLALNKPATQSSTDTVNGIFAAASRAVDGNTDGNMSAGSVSQTLPESSHWWQVDLGAESYIDNIHLYNRTNCCSTEPTLNYIFVSNVPFVSTDPNATIAQPEVTYFLSHFGRIIDVNRTGRYIRVQLEDIHEIPLHLAEVEVMGIPIPTNPGIGGQWRTQPDLDIPVLISPVHISLLPNGKLLFWGRDKGTDTDPKHIDNAEGGCNTYLWDLPPMNVWDPPPTTNHITVIRNNRTNLFCSAHSFLPNGNLFVAGGTEVPTEGGQKRHDVDGEGTVQTNIFDYMSQSWVAGPNMKKQRYYPSVVTLSNGETLIVTGTYVQKGVDGQPIHPLKLTSNRDTDVLDQNQSLRWTENSLPRNVPNYPYAHLGPDGSVLVVSGTNGDGLAYNPSTNIWDDPPPLNFKPVLDLKLAHDQGTSVMYDKGKIMVIGGCPTLTTSSRDTETIDINPPNSLPNASWVSAKPMNFLRYYATSVLMPDGQVFVVGGSRCGGANNIVSGDCHDGATMYPEIYNPAAGGSWSIMARQEVIRMYHSVALLMPDARILVAGGGRTGAVGEFDANGQRIDNTTDPNALLFAHHEVEIFSPPYLFNLDGTPATRPAIINGPPSINYGQSFNVEIGNIAASEIGQVVLVRLPSVTHTLNFDQRRVVLSRTMLNQQTLSVTAPANGNECPPGPYMLFVIGQNGAPSVAKIIFVNNPVGNLQQQSPSNLKATATSNTEVLITWMAPSAPVDHYELYRKQSISAPFIRIADNIDHSDTMFLDPNRTGSVAYLYQVRAVNSSGISSQPSNIDLATTMRFTDDPITAGVTVIKAQHIYELRIAVNAVRATAGLTQASWTDASLTDASLHVIFVSEVHIRELRENLDEALRKIFLSEFVPPGYMDQTITRKLTFVRGAHVEQIRQAVR